MTEKTTPITAIVRQEKPKNELAAKNWETSLRLSYLALPVRRVDDIVTLPNPAPLVKIGKECGEGQVMAALVVILNDLIDFFNVPNSMDQAQVIYTAGLIRDEYFYFTIEDFKVFSDNAKKRRYGKLFGGIDGSVVFDWLEQYAAERTRAFAEHNDCRAFSDKERYERRGDVHKVADLELRSILGRNYKPTL